MGAFLILVAAVFCYFFWKELIEAFGGRSRDEEIANEQAKRDEEEEKNRRG